MAEKDLEHEAMVVPRGARIIAGEGGQIELDVQGDLILQESQRGLTGLSSHHGSILIDDDVTVRSRSVKACHLVRVRGRLETSDIQAASVAVEGGAMSCVELNTGRLESSGGRLDVKGITAKEVRISGGQVEIGAINAERLRLENRVRGTLLISSAKDRHIDETVQLKGGFETDVELLGYLLKYRHQILSGRVLQELESSDEGRDFQRLLSGAETAADAAPADSGGKPDAAVIERLQRYGEELKASLPEAAEQSAIFKLLVTSLEQGDLPTLMSLFTRWSDSLRKEREQLPDETSLLLDEIGRFVKVPDGG